MPQTITMEASDASALFETCYDRIYRYVLSLIRDPAEADDLTQETFLRAYRRHDTLHDAGALTTWLYRIAVTEALQFLRRDRKMRASLRDDVPNDATPSPVQASIIKLDVNAALKALEPTDCALLLLRYQEGLDYRAIAEVLDCAVGTVGSRLNRARERLRKGLGSSYGRREEISGVEHQNL